MAAQTPLLLLGTLFSIALLLLSHATTSCIAATVEIGADGKINGDGDIDGSVIGDGEKPREIHAIFANHLPRRSVNLYWAGNAGHLNERSLQMYYGPIGPNGDKREMDGYEGQVFVVTDVGGYGRLGEFTLGTTKASDGENGKETHVVTEEGVSEYRAKFPPDGDVGSKSSRREETAKKCRLVDTDASIDGNDDRGRSFLQRCQACVGANGCGFSPVRDRLYTSEGQGNGGCFAAHSVVTVNTVNECKELFEIEQDANGRSVQALLNLSAELVLRSGKVGYNASKLLRLAFLCLLRAADDSNDAVAEAHNNSDNDEKSAKDAKAMHKKVIAALYELTAKLEAVFDDADMSDLLSSSRHAKLEEIHPNMETIPRRSMEDAMEYVLRGMPVVITDMFDRESNPIASKWTLEYLNREVFGGKPGSGGGGGGEGEVPKFNVAADAYARCCQYFESQGKAKDVGYPYPFAPTTHLYRDTFDGFVKTARKANRNAVSVGGGATGGIGNMTNPKLLHYLHEIVMNNEGRATVAGGDAPKQLEDDLEATKAQLLPLAMKQPFFGKFAYAKVWLGQRGIVMPLHYDATDNLYVMAYGRKRVIIGEPGQLDQLYRYPNQHPLVGSSQVNLTESDLDRYPNFYVAKLREVVIGPGDVLYLPAWWWHQFEQPFEDTAALNLWSSDRKDAPSAHMRDMIVRDHILADDLEGAIAPLYGKDAGIALDVLANGEKSLHHDGMDKDKLKEAKLAMLQAVETWQDDVSQLPGGHRRMKESPYTLLEEYLIRTHATVFRGSPEGWKPGDGWDLSKIAKLPRELRSRCEEAPESSPFMSICA